MRGGAPDGAPSGDVPLGDMPSDDGPSDESDGKNAAMGGFPGGGRNGSSDSETTYETADDYIASLNGDDAWINYDEATNTATITGLAGFVAACKTSTSRLSGAKATPWLSAPAQAPKTSSSG